MSLQLSNATVGYDRTGVQRLIASLDEQTVQQTNSLLIKELEKLNTATDAAWVGSSADIFKKNMQTDVNNITTALTQTFDTLKNEIYQIVNEMDNIDQNVISARGD